jgi:autotransporter-associated beta strand protein
MKLSLFLRPIQPLITVGKRRFLALLQHGVLIRWLVLGGLFLLRQPAYSSEHPTGHAACSCTGDDVTWRAHPVDNDWENPSNWSTGSVPDDLDNALFDVSNIRNVQITSDSVTFIQDIVFNETADAFTLTATDGALLDGINVTNNSAVEQNFVAESNGVFNFTGDVSGPVTFTTQPSNSATESGGFLEFGTSSAGTAIIYNLGATVAGALGGSTLFFYFYTSAENSTIINYGATVAGATGGTCTFSTGSPTAGNATLIANGGSNGGGGGFFTFDNFSTGGTARVELFGNGYLDISPHGSQPMTIGSLEGDGIVYLGDNTLTVVGNGLDTIFSGTLLPGDPSGGPGTGGLAKSSSTTLTLTGASLYTAGTTVTAGTLAVSNTTGSATGTGAVFVNAGTLAGGGTIGGPVTVGTGSGAGAILAPAQGSNKPLTLALQSSLTLSADATYTYTFKAKNNKSRTDLVVANGVTINGATVNLSGQTRGSLKLGLTLTMINNRSASPISGTFSNLPDGGIVNINGNNFQASYEGGDGNDLTLTVVP